MRSSDRARPSQSGCTRWAQQPRRCRAILGLLGPVDRVLASAAEPPRKGDAPPRLAVGQPWEAPGPGRPPATEGATVTDEFPDPTEVPPGKVTDRAPLSWRVESALGAEAEVAHADEARRRLKSRVKRRIGRAEGLVKGLVAKADAAANAERLRQDGELAKAMLGTFQRTHQAHRVAVQHTADQHLAHAPRRPRDHDPWQF